MGVDLNPEIALYGEMVIIIILQMLCLSQPVLPLRGRTYAPPGLFGGEGPQRPGGVRWGRAGAL